jgi:hypothetical protein
MGLDTKTYRLTDCQSQCDFDFDLTAEFSKFPSEGQTLRREEYMRSACKHVLCELKSFCVRRCNDTGSVIGRSDE